MNASEIHKIMPPEAVPDKLHYDGEDEVYCVEDVCGACAEVNTIVAERLCIAELVVRLAEKGWSLATYDKEPGMVARWYCYSRDGISYGDECGTPLEALVAAYAAVKGGEKG